MRLLIIPTILLLSACSTPTFVKRMTRSSAIERGSGSNQYINRGTTQVNLSYKERSGAVKQIDGFTILEEKGKCFAMIEEHYEATNFKTSKSQYFINTHQVYYPFLNPNRMKIHIINVAKKSRVKVVSGSEKQYILKMDYDSKQNSLIPYTSTTFENTRKDSVKVDLKQSVEIKFSDMKSARDAQGFFWRQISKCKG